MLDKVKKDYFDIIFSSYRKLQQLVKNERTSTKVRDLLIDIYSSCADFLHIAERISLISKVESKEYFAFSNGSKFSRAINSRLFSDDKKFVINFLRNQNSEPSNKLVQQYLYTTAISFCAAIDLLKDGDQKTPGTYFEYFVAYMIGSTMNVEPTTSIPILHFDDEEKKLPTDLIFDLGKKNRKFHVPVKTSTRERSIMIWAHQRLVDGVYGTGRYLGTPVLLAETKVDKRKKEVVEICLPDQWILYQLYISQLTRVYYLDIPKIYLGLKDQIPSIPVQEFSDFFTEWESIR